ncbi:expressed unknown protein [Seminavis robusta]|uniref:Uncharacterized protein n=1 Tax=Seminavis robusta TaxID=568900 RepID=A0A9N8D969_9STRA|nr:expressed unknown protein [Seminavis robusta]|eukprot:Sro3_g002100.1 n/a (204) ;mRNA; r:51682-52293
MALYNPSLSHHENQYYVDQNRSSLQAIADVFCDCATVWLTESSLKLWIRVWLCLLMLGCMSPLAFLPHPFAVINLVGMMVILVLNGRELIRVRGVNKNMGWQHIVGWMPVLLVNIICLTTDSIGDDGMLTWEAARDDSYKKARYVVIVYNTITLGISVLFDAVDTILYYRYDKTNIDRSQWTTSKLVLQKQEPKGAQDTTYTS